jgi:hypothetical protein
MYPGVYHPGRDSTSDGDDDGSNLPTGPLITLLGFELETYQWHSPNLPTLFIA